MELIVNALIENGVQVAVSLGRTGHVPNFRAYAIR